LPATWQAAPFAQVASSLGTWLNGHSVKEAIQTASNIKAGVVDRRRFEVVSFHIVFVSLQSGYVKGMIEQF
jgi:hypothetical protein